MHASSRLAAAAVLSLAALAATSISAEAGPPPATQTATSTPTGTPSSTSASPSPLAGDWGLYTGTIDPAYNAWKSATGTNKTLLAKIALQPKVHWFGSWIPTSKVSTSIGNYIRDMQNGDSNALVQLAIFRLWPKGEKAKADPLTEADQVAYRQWVRAAAGAIGSARVAMILEPDLAVSLKGWQPSVRLSLARYAARVFGALPRTSVYLDASDADWLKVSAAVSMLRTAGVSYVRGFALGATHYASTSGEASYGGSVISGLANDAIPGRHFVIDTADNGRPFTWLQYYQAHPNGRFDNAEVCKSTTQLRCVTLGYRPTTNVPDPTQVDAYLWFGRPWLDYQADPFDMSRALAVARTTPH